MRSPLQWAAAGWCLLMVAFLTVVQFGGGPSPPLALYLVFSGVWLFGAAMLLTFPRFGAAGTALYGVLLAVQVINMHGGSALNWGIAAGSLAGAGLAGAYLYSLLRPGGRAA